MIFILLSRLHKSQPAHKVSMERLYRYSGITRQGYYQGLARHRAEAVMVREFKALILEYRRFKDRRAGLRSLYYNLEIKEKYGIGVNKFERLASEAGLSLRPLRIRVVTTQSSHQSWNYPNLAKSLKVSNINELVVGDLTYIYLGKDRYYIFCLTDVYSCRIVGIHLSQRMRAIDAKVALDQWASLRGKHCLKSCIHHTDGGSQYFSTVYLSTMRSLNLRISVAGNCLENGYAEQRNSMLKHHLIPTIELFSSLQVIQAELKRIIRRYNHDRKQKRLGWLSPVAFEKRCESDPDRVSMTIK